MASALKGRRRIVFVSTVGLAVTSCSLSVPARDPGDDARRAATIGPTFPACAPMPVHADAGEATVVGELEIGQQVCTMALHKFCGEAKLLGHTWNPVCRQSDCMNQCGGTLLVVTTDRQTRTALQDPEGNSIGWSAYDCAVADLRKAIKRRLRVTGVFVPPERNYGDNRTHEMRITSACWDVVLRP